MSKKYKHKWPQYRMKQLDELRELIREVSALNRGNCVIQRIQRCIKLADRLDKSDMRLRRQSFVHWLLYTHAIAELPPEKDS